MDNPNDSSRINGRIHNTGGKKRRGRRLPSQGVPPEDFGERLERLKEAGGLARALGVDSKQSLRRRKGVEPCWGAMRSIFRFADRTPGGRRILTGEGAQMTLREDKRRTRTTAPAAHLQMRIQFIKEHENERHTAASSRG